MYVNAMTIAEVIQCGIDRLMNELLYTQMRKSQREIEAGSSKLVRFYQGEMMSNTSWYLAMRGLSGGVLRSFRGASKIVEKAANEGNGTKLKRMSELILGGSKEEGPSMQSVEGPKELDAYWNGLKTCETCQEKNSGPIFEKKCDSAKVEVLFVGDYPLNIDNRPGQCFQGSRRELLLNMIKAMGLSDEQYLLTLGSKCSSEDEELVVKRRMMKNCMSHLMTEISLVRPKVVVALGALVSNYLLGERKKLSQIHGQFFERTFAKYTTQIVPLFHPDFLLINPKMKQTTWIDLKKIIKYLKK